MNASVVMLKIPIHENIYPKWDNFLQRGFTIQFKNILVYLVSQIIKSFVDGQLVFKVMKLNPLTIGSPTIKSNFALRG